MKRVRYLAYRFLTANDFFNLYKPLGTQAGGGGQLYIDFPTSRITPARWGAFFRGVIGLSASPVTHGLQWRFPVRSIGIQQVPETMELYQRRPQSICVPNQNLHTRSANRIAAWHPDRGFPRPRVPTSRTQLPAGLAVFLARTYENEVWAGWFRLGRDVEGPARDNGARLILTEMLSTADEGATGFISVRDGNIYLDETDANLPFASSYRGPLFQPELPTERDFDEDEVELEAEPAESRVHWRQVRSRNRAVVRELKELYQHKCQITGNKYVFPKLDGEGYTEAHHLLALGLGGADKPENIIIVSAHIHRMLHHARVGPINLDRIRREKNGWSSLDIKINGTAHRIRWHSQHARLVEATNRAR